MLINLETLPKECVFAILDRKGCRVYINYSINLIGAIPRLWEECSRAGTTLELEVLSVTTDIETLKLHTEYWRDRYSRVGYAELLPRGRKVLQYDVRCLVDGDYDGVDVMLVSARGDRKVVGKFKTMEEAVEFVDMCYGADNSYNLPVYAVNSRTREFMLESGKSKISI